MQIGLIKIWPIDNNKTLKARADVQFITEHGEFTLKGIRVVTLNEKTTFVGPPQEKYLVAGKTKYKDILWFDKGFEKFLYDKILVQFNAKNKN